MVVIRPLAMCKSPKISYSLQILAAEKRPLLENLGYYNPNLVRIKS